MLHPITKLVTHSGAFHADDVLAYTILKTIHPLASLVRTRNPDLTAPARDRIIFDVGRRFDPDRNQFDHHQPDRLVREDGIPFSAFGLIWRTFGRDYLLRLGIDHALLDDIHQLIDRDLVHAVDRIDNGVAQSGDPAMQATGLIPMLALFRPDFDDKRTDAMDQSFLQASNVARNMLEAMVRTQAANLRASTHAARAIASRHQKDVLLLNESMPWLSAVLASGEPINFVVMPGIDEWQINVVNVTSNSFEVRKPLPAAWAGKVGDDLALETGVDDALFCHAGRFIACARSRSGALALLDLARAA